MNIRTLVFASLALVAAIPAIAQEPVVGKPDESLFTDKDPRLHANKQAALHIMRELLQCNYWDQAEKWLTDRYIQHNPNAASGREGVVKFFNSLKRPRAATVPWNSAAFSSAEQPRVACLSAFHSGT